MKWTIKAAVLLAVSAAALGAVWVIDGAAAAKFITLKVLHLTAAAGVLYIIARVLSPVTSPERWLAQFHAAAADTAAARERKLCYVALAVGAMIARALFMGLALLGVAVGFPLVE